MTLSEFLEKSRNRLYSLNEFEKLDFPFDDNRYELIFGEIKVTPPAGFEHGRIGSRLVRHVNLFNQYEKLGIILEATRFQIAPGFGPAPDVAFITAATIPPNTKGAVPTLPDLAVEVWSPRDLDTKAHQVEARAKIRHYQTAGVSIVWAINLSTKQVEVYHPDMVDPVQVLGIEDVLSGEEVIPGFTMPVRSLFE